MLTEKLPAESQRLADKLKREEKMHEALGDVTTLTQMLDKENALRNQAENYVLEALQKRLEGRRWQSSAGTRTSCCNRRSFSFCFIKRGRGRVEHTEHQAALSWMDGCLQLMFNTHF